MAIKLLYEQFWAELIKPTFPLQPMLKLHLDNNKIKFSFYVRRMGTSADDYGTES
jgi:hypothetical protein